MNLLAETLMVYRRRERTKVIDKRSFHVVQRFAAFELHSGSPLSSCTGVRSFRVAQVFAFKFVCRQRFAAFRLHSGSLLSSMFVY